MRAYANVNVIVGCHRSTHVSHFCLYYRPLCKYVDVVVSGGLEIECVKLLSKFELGILLLTLDDDCTIAKRRKSIFVCGPIDWS